MVRLEEFKADISDGSLSLEKIVHKHILAARSVVLADDEERDLRIAISEKFEVPITTICIVGSAKLGFRLLLKPRNVKKQLPERPQFSEFDDYSDVDVAIISQSRFLMHWRKVYDYFRDGGYTSQNAWKSDETNQKHSFYLMQGWVRPDAMPGTGLYNQQEAWTTKVNEVNQMRIVKVPIKIGLYFDDKFLIGYHANAIRKSKEQYELS